MKYAVIRTGGKQYRVLEGQELNIEKLEMAVDAASAFDEVLLVADETGVHMGYPLLDAQVQFKVVAHGRGDKVRIIKMKRRKHHMKKQGHRQWFTRVRIESIGVSAAVAA